MEEERISFPVRMEKKWIGKREAKLERKERSKKGSKLCALICRGEAKAQLST